MKKKSFGGLLFTIDRPKGYVKTWPQPGGREKSFTYPVDYGYLPRHTGEDGEGLDFFVGDAEDGHLESFQKLRKNDEGKYILDETKFLVGVTDQERETIYKLYGPEVWHRKVYRDMDELEQDLPKFAGKKKARYGVSEKAAAVGSVYRHFAAFPSATAVGAGRTIADPAYAWLNSVPTILGDFARSPGSGPRTLFQGLHDAGHLAGIAGTTAGAGYGAYRGGKALYNRLNPKEEEMTPKQAALARYGLDKVADIDKKITGEILMADVGRKKVSHIGVFAEYSLLLDRVRV